MTELVLEVPDAHPLLNVWQRKHWRAKKAYIEGLSWLVSMSLRESGWKRWQTAPIARCCVLIERHEKRPPAPDWDGLISKALLDCLVVRSKRNPNGLGVIEDDNPTCIEAYAMFPGLHTKPRMIVRIFTGEDRINRFLAAYETKIRGG